MFRPPPPPATAGALVSDICTDSGLKYATYGDPRLLGVGLTKAEAELGFCEGAVNVIAVWQRLRELSIRGYAITGGNHFASLHVASAVFLPNGRFEFGHAMGDASGAEVALIIPMIDVDGRVHSFVACDLGFRRAACWKTTPSILGMENINLPRIEALQVFKDALGWLQSGRDGIVILDFPAAARILCGGETLAVDDVNFGRELAGKLQIGSPRIVTRRDVRRAA